MRTYTSQCESNVEVPQILRAQGRRFPMEGAPSLPGPVCVHSCHVHSSGLAQVPRDTPTLNTTHPPAPVALVGNAFVGTKIWTDNMAAENETQL